MPKSAAHPSSLPSPLWYGAAVSLGRRNADLPQQAGRANGRAPLGAVAIVLSAVCVAAACGNVNRALERIVDARQLSADLLVHFTEAVGASDRAVMADTDTASVDYAHEAVQAKEAVQRDVNALRPILEELNYADESRQLAEFVRRFGEYDALDRQVLDLAVGNTNLKAQQLSFGSGEQAAESFSRALDAVGAVASGDESWHVKALCAKAVSALREAQVLEAPHIAESSDSGMTALEARMTASLSEAQATLAALRPLAPASAGGRLADAKKSLDDFLAIHAQVLTLSRQNTNVRSLALSLDQKRKLVAPCEESLQALRDALAKRGYTTKPQR